MYQSDSAPWLEFYAWDDDGTAKTDLVYNTAGLSIVVKRDNLADSAALTLSAASGPTDYDAGKFHAMGGNKYRVGIAVGSINTFTGKISVGGSYTGGVIVGTTEVVSAYNPANDPMAAYTQPTGFLGATFPTNVASTTNITAGTITTVTNLTNAPTNGDLTATMKASVTTAATAATPTVGALGSQAKLDVNAEADTALADYDGPTKAEMDAGHAALPAALEAAILDEGDATALLAAIAAKVEEFLINEGDATATIAAIATACNNAVVAGTVGTNVASVKSTVEATSTTVGTLSTQASVDAISTKLGTPAGSSVSADIAAVKTDTGNLVTRISATLFNGITSFASWIGAMVGKTADAGTLAEINATTAGATYDNTTDSPEAVKDAGGASVAVSSFEAAALLQLVQDDTGETTASAGSVAKIAQGAAGGAVQVSGFEAAALLELVQTDTGETAASAGSVAKLSQSPSAGAGSGARTITVTVDDGTDPLENAIVRLTEGANTFVLPTDVSGEAVFNLDDATYTVAITKSGYTYAGTTLAVAADASVTYSMSAISITTPSDPDLSTGVLRCFDKQGAAESGVSISVYLVDGPATKGKAYEKDVWTEVSNGSGDVSFVGLVRGATYRGYRGTDDGNTTEFEVPLGKTSFEIPEIIGVD